MNPLAWIDDELATLARQSLHRELAVRSSPQQAMVSLNETPLINFGSNDYLGLANELGPVAAEQLKTCGWGSGASPLVSGRGIWHARLEQELAAFEGTAAALLFPTGYAANVGAITALAGKGDAVFSDAKNHSSIIDGCRLSRAQVFIFPHGDTFTLSRQLEAAEKSFRRLLIAVDGLFSMDGDLAPLSKIAELAEKYGAMLLVDEAHATGVLGKSGRGAAEELGVESAVHIRVGTLSKALGSHGGFVAGTQSLIQWLANRARPYVFSTAAPEASAAAGLAALSVVRNEPHRRQELLASAEYLRNRLVERGFDPGSSASQIIPVVLGDAEKVVQTAGRLRREGLFVPGIRPPTVPPGESLLRISLSYLHTREMLDSLVESL